MTLPLLLIYLPVYLRDFSGTQLSLPSTLAHLLGIVFGYFLTYASNQFKLLLASSLILASGWVSLQGYDLWLHKLNYGTYSGLISEPAPAFVVRDDQGRLQTEASFKGKFVVLDFWTTSCGVCFQKFPHLQQYYTRYQNNPRVKFFAINIPLDRDKPQDAQEAIRKRHYTFPVLYAEDRLAESLFKIKGYPTVIVINPAQQIIYRGELDGVEKIF
ncbi:TlpA family protein disulfide reductase [Nostoc sp. CHAB 5834]|nr:TlpA family protein disulfide reductase [Nostoc sp. CHAB 5834]